MMDFSKMGGLLGMMGGGQYSPPVPPGLFNFNPQQGGQPMPPVQPAGQPMPPQQQGGMKNMGGLFGVMAGGSYSPQMPQIPPMPAAQPMDQQSGGDRENLFKILKLFGFGG